MGIISPTEEPSLLLGWDTCLGFQAEGHAWLRIRRYFPPLYFFSLLLKSTCRLPASHLTCPKQGAKRWESRSGREGEEAGGGGGAEMTGGRSRDERRKRKEKKNPAVHHVALFTLRPSICSLHSPAAGRMLRWLKRQIGHKIKTKHSAVKQLSQHFMPGLFLLKAAWCCPHVP